ncbi:hypothetical protein [Lysinibacillus sp. FW12]|uniref:hypothetical protein n=1 Tax=Lysinibacillus sp. FW12 TaxID=3096079 RepID=UPI003D73EDFD
MVDRAEKVEDKAPGVIGKNREMDRTFKLKDRKEKVEDRALGVIGKNRGSG